MNEKFEKQKDIGEIRKEKLAEAMGRIKNELSEEERILIKGILLFGSTAGGTATEKSDVDIWIVPEEKIPFNSEVVKKVMEIIEDILPDEEIQYGLRPVISPDGRTAKFLTRKNPKHTGKEPAYEFLYSKDDQSKIEIDGILKKAREKQKGE